MIRSGVVAATIAAALTLSACGGGDSGDSSGDGAIKVGLLLSLTGPAAPFGIPERDAAKAAADAINADGGIDGRKIELITYDDGTEPTECSRGVTSLVQDGAVAIVGGSTGSCTLAAAPIAQRSKVPLLAPNGTIDVTDSDAAFYPWVFRTATNDLLTTKVVFDRATAGGAKRIGVFYQEDAYGENTADYVDQLAKKAGVKVVAKASAPLTASEVAAQATKLRNADPELVLVQASSPAVGAAFVRGADEVGLDVPLWGGLGLAQRPFVKASGKAGEGFNLAGFGNPYEPGDNAKPLVDALPSKQMEGFAELIGANGVVTVAEAAKAIDGDLSGETLRDAIESLCGVTTYAEGELCYSKDDHDGWSEDSLVDIVIKDGQFVTRK